MSIRSGFACPTGNQAWCHVLQGLITDTVHVLNRYPILRVPGTSFRDPVTHSLLGTLSGSGSSPFQELEVLRLREAGAVCQFNRLGERETPELI